MTGMQQFMPQQQQQQQGKGGLPEGFDTSFGFTVDPSEASSFDAIPAGNYEAVITSVEPKVFKTGASGLVLTLTVRDDVPQPFEGAKKRKLFSNLVAQQNCLFQWHGAAVAVGLPKNEKINIQTFPQKLLNKPVLVKVGVQKDDPTRNDVKGLMPSKVSNHAVGNHAVGNQVGVPPVPQQDQQLQSPQAPNDHDTDPFV